MFDIPGMDKRACLLPSSDATLAFYVVPADTLTLGRVFYRRTKAVAGVRRLARDPDWRVKHSFHFGFMSTGYPGRLATSTSTAISTSGSRRSRQLAPSIERTGTGIFTWLVEQQIPPKDRCEFDRHFTNSLR